jgi:hypothetical protein
MIATAGQAAAFVRELAVPALAVLYIVAPFGLARPSDRSIVACAGLGCDAQGTQPSEWSLAWSLIFIADHAGYSMVVLGWIIFIICGNG